jgi:general stress protein 26
MDAELKRALALLHSRGGWVHLGTVGKHGWPHVTPVMMGIRGEVCLFSITGKQKKRNIERDPRVCVELSRPGDFFHIVMWGTMQIRNDSEAQEMWAWLITDQLGDSGLEQRRRVLSPEGTSLGVFRPQRQRLFAVPAL